MLRVCFQLRVSICWCVAVYKKRTQDFMMSKLNEVKYIM